MHLSPIIVGTMRLGKWGAGFSRNEYEQFIDQCIDLGLVDFDHADIYGGYTTEAEFGEVLVVRKDLRPKIRITTKCGIRMMSDNRSENTVKSYETSSQYILDSVDQSLKNFHTDYIDTLLIHRPDYLMNYEELGETISSLKVAGKIKHFGVSNFSVSQIETLSKYIDVENHQFEFSLSEHSALDDGRLDQCLTSKIKPTVWSPLAGGTLSADNTRNNPKFNKCVLALEEKYSLMREQLLLAWIVKHPVGIVPVLGSTKILRYASAAEALDVDMSKEDWYKLFEAWRDKEVL